MLPTSKEGMGFSEISISSESTLGMLSHWLAAVPFEDPTLYSFMVCKLLSDAG